MTQLHKMTFLITIYQIPIKCFNHLRDVKIKYYDNLQLTGDCISSQLMLKYISNVIVATL